MEAILFHTVMAFLGIRFRYWIIIIVVIVVILALLYFASNRPRTRY